MTPERYQQIGRLYQDAVSLEPQRRGVFLQEACAEDEALRQAVEKLLAADEQAEAQGFIAEPARAVAAEMLAQERSQQLAGRSLSHYQILSLLGVGGMGEVWLARDTQLERQAALKLLPAQFTQDPERLQRFYREARSASALNHPNILTIYEIGAADELHFIATEYIDGVTLRQRLTEGRPSLRETLAIVRQMAEALDTAHQAGIIHRDIKPENVMIRRDGLVKVLDFGLAKLTEQKGRRGEDEPTLPLSSPRPHSPSPLLSTMPGLVMGTPRYMSPEQARGLKVDARTDVFSLGVVFYEMVTGEPAFAGASTAEVFAALLEKEPPPLRQCAPDVPDRLQEIISRMLVKKPEERYESMRAFAAELEQVSLLPSGESERLFASASEHDTARNRKETKPQLPPDTRATTTDVQRAAVKTASFLSARLVRPGWLAACGLVLMAVALLLWLNRRPATLTDKDTILLAEFENKTGEAVFNGTLNQGLAVQIGQSPFLSVFPEARLKEALRLMGRAPDEAITPAIARGDLSASRIEGVYRRFNCDARQPVCARVARPQCANR